MTAPSALPSVARAFLHLRALTYFVLAVPCMAFGGLLLCLTPRTFDPGKTQRVAGALVRMERAPNFVELELEGAPLVFRRAFPQASPGLAADLPPGTPVEVTVSAAAYARANDESARFVDAVAVRAAGRELAGLAQYRAAYAKNRRPSLWLALGLVGLGLCLALLGVVRTRSPDVRDAPSSHTPCAEHLLARRAPFALREDFLLGPRMGYRLTAMIGPPLLAACFMAAWQLDGKARALWYVGALGLSLFLRTLRHFALQLTPLQLLGREGQILRVTVLSTRLVGDGHVVRYRLPCGSQVEEALGAHRPLMCSADLLVLASRDERMSLVIREDGFPLLLTC